MEPLDGAKARYASSWKREWGGEARVPQGPGSHARGDERAREARPRDSSSIPAARGQEGSADACGLGDREAENILQLCQQLGGWAGSG